MSDWQPIETAPKDGTFILVATASGIVGEAWRYADDGRHYWAQEHPSDYANNGPLTATHWMPLPAPPVQS